eukprot:635109-Amphidinium_carterae.1
MSGGSGVLFTRGGAAYSARAAIAVDSGQVSTEKHSKQATALAKMVLSMVMVKDPSHCFSVSSTCQLSSERSH